MKIKLVKIIQLNIRKRKFWKIYQNLSNNHCRSIGFNLNILN